MVPSVLRVFLFLSLSRFIGRQDRSAQGSPGIKTGKNGPSGGTRNPGRALRVPGALTFGWGPRPGQVFAALLLAACLLVPAGGYAVPAGTILTNTAQADFILDGIPQAAESNSVVVITTLPGVHSTLELFRYAPSSPSVLVTVGITPYFDGAGFVPAPAPTDPATGNSISLGLPVPMEEAVYFTQGDAVFVRLIDPDGNLSPAVADTLRVAVEDPASMAVEILLLTETGNDTGTFTGYVRSGAGSETANDGILYGYPGAQFSAEYTDPSDSSDTSSAPFSFDAEGVLWITALAGKDSVSIGDFLTYTITVENTSDHVVPGTFLTVDLPVGFRFRPGTTIIDGLASPDPLAAPNGRSLSFSVGDIPAGGTVSITFVAAVGAGARPGKAVAPSIASSGTLLSNTALATVKVTEDLFKNRNTIMGRVFSGGCGGDPATGVGGIGIFLEDGTRVVTDEKGRYHFEGVRSGTHVVQMDLETVPAMYEIVSCDNDTRQAGRPWSRFVDLAGGALWRVDFYLLPKAPEEGKTSLVIRTLAGPEGVTFSATMSGKRVPLRNVLLKVTLPDGVVYEPGTARLEGEPIGDPEVEGNDLSWNIGEVPGTWKKGLTFQTRIQEELHPLLEGHADGLETADEYGTFKNVQGLMAEVVSKASITFDTPVRKGISTPEVENVLLKVVEREETRTRKFVFRPHFATFKAQLTTEDRKALSIIAAQFNSAEIGRVQVTGHTDNVPISKRGRRVFADNYELSRARARSVAAYLRDFWDLNLDLFTIDGKGPDESLAPNETVRGRILNRRVEVNVITTTVKSRSELVPIDDQNAAEMIIEGLRPGQIYEPAAREPIPEMPDSPDPMRDFGWLETENGTLRWILPESGFLPHIPSLKIAVVHPPQHRIRIYLNGEEISPLHFDSTSKNSLGTAAISLWRGVDIIEGDNLLTAVAVDSRGTEAGRIERTVHYSGPPVYLEFMPDLSRLVADGKTPPVVAVRLTDENGFPARRGIIGQYYAQSPSRTLQDARSATTEAFPDRHSAYSTYSVKEDGIAYLELEPTTSSGEAVLVVRLRDEDRQVPVWLDAHRETWILVGLAEGTVGYNVASGNMEGLEDSGNEEDLYTEGRLAFFAKGRIKGEYLLTMSYDTNGPHGASGEGFHGTIDPDTYYTLYGDATEQGYEAPTSRKLYLKIEKKNFFALFGDTRTDLTVTELSRYDRRITGFRSELRGQDYSYNLFASETQQGFVKDEIPGDGTSGLYHLSAQDVVVNSERVTIEVRDRFQSHLVLSETTMTRHLDYSIDYDTGTLFFKSPVPERDAGFNPVFIVVDYETLDPGATGVTFGGRGEAVLHGGRTTVGASVVHEARGDGDGELAGIDATVKITGETTLKAEAAASSRDLLGDGSDGSAYILEVQHDSDKLTGTAYIRRLEPDFGLGQQRASEGGMRKVGAQARYSLDNSWSLTGEVFSQENLETGAQREVEELGATRERGRLSYSASLRQATDTDSDGTQEQSGQMTAGVEWQSEDDRWNLRASREQSLVDNGNTDYPTRTLLGSDYRISERVSLYAEQEYSDGDETSVSSTRLGLKATPWAGGTASSTIDRRFDENGDRVYATTGLNQTWQVSKRWQASAGFEGASVIQGNVSEPLNPDAAPVSSGEDFAAFSVGAGYRAEKWEADIRLEARDAATSDKWGVVSGVYGEPAEGLGLSSDLKYFRTEDSGDLRTTQSDLRFGLVYRPWERYWTFLDKLELVIDEETGGEFESRTWKTVNNFNANFRPNDNWQLSLHLGTKYVKDTVEEQVFSGFTHLLGAEGRYDLTARWDVGFWSSVLSAEETGTEQYGLGASLGYGIMENAWISFGYNLEGFEDADFSQGNFTAQGPYIKFRFKFDQETLKGMLTN